MGRLLDGLRRQSAGNNSLDPCSSFQVLDCSCSNHPVRIGILVCARTSDMVAEDRVEHDRKWFSFTSVSMEQSGRIHHDQFRRFDLVAIRLGNLSITRADVACGSMVAAFKAVISPKRRVLGSSSRDSSAASSTRFWLARVMGEARRPTMKKERALGGTAKGAGRGR